MKRIESPQNSLVKYWKKLVTTRKERERSGEFIVEGFHLVEEAIKNNGEVLTIIVREGVDIPHTWNIDDIFVVEVTQAIAKELSETEHPQGIFAQCKQREVTEEEQVGWTKLLLIDAVQDPGNVGTMIRTADAAGIDAVILGKGSADAFNPKTVRSAQGSHFHIPVVKGDLGDWIDSLQDRLIPVIGTALDNAVVYSEVKKGDKFALIMGNEGNGIHPDLLAKTDANVIIPILGQAESLNVAVASGILLYNFAVSAK
ncbi:RNA methyltransferase [Viridibacillus sp. FSL R5-0477]|uniref:tRNA/rRNA methyltransferase n=1 Tax=Viridibacillus arenosi FSL R5-213 TaxID=1227360 RepID=W4EPP2_9BACL|nr:MULTISPECIES: RNA methyltransferase [Viridibacillus]ETT82558.1 tRNA/rRNA methyltransferase [Viridibacillus arenosi FSL R5-213]OMC85525.1 RNA methyltransferase [Viridibacillus sp. FSL H8-0123]OMC87200.1 RNA methyltransferase [Viridibacillus sp. FSL H7-0596]OMC92360.1 RNA methyltransferase [Viridibacillus arenosi]